VYRNLLKRKCVRVDSFIARNSLFVQTGLSQLPTYRYHCLSQHSLTRKSEAILRIKAEEQNCTCSNNNSNDYKKTGSYIHHRYVTTKPNIVLAFSEIMQFLWVRMYKAVRSSTLLFLCPKASR